MFFVVVGVVYLAGVFTGKAVFQQYAWGWPVHVAKAIYVKVRYGSEFKD